MILVDDMIATLGHFIQRPEFDYGRVDFSKFSWRFLYAMISFFLTVVSKEMTKRFLKKDKEVLENSSYCAQNFLPIYRRKFAYIL